MTNLLKIPTWADGQYIYAVIETPRGSTCKLDFDPALRAFTLAKPLMAGLTYPYDWGFIPSTKAEDGDPLDVLVIHDAKTYPGVVLRCRPVGILEVEQKSKGKGKERNDRVFAMPDRSPLETDLQDIRRLPSRAREELEEFFRATNALEDKKLEFLGWQRSCPRQEDHQAAGSAVTSKSWDETDAKGRHAATSHVLRSMRSVLPCADVMTLSISCGISSNFRSDSLAAATGPVAARTAFQPRCLLSWDAPARGPFFCKARYTAIWKKAYGYDSARSEGCGAVDATAL
jgi:inorganic pyrophosphatase